MNEQKTSIIKVKESDLKSTAFQDFIKEIDSKLRKEEKHTWMIKDKEHINQNE